MDTRTFPDVPFERYVDDGVVHCVSQQQAEMLRDAIGQRIVEVGLKLHPDKTRVVYCKDSNRRDSSEHLVYVPGVHISSPARAEQAKRCDFISSSPR